MMLNNDNLYKSQIDNINSMFYDCGVDSFMSFHLQIQNEMNGFALTKKKKCDD